MTADAESGSLIQKREIVQRELMQTYELLQSRWFFRFIPKVGQNLILRQYSKSLSRLSPAGAVNAVQLLVFILGASACVVLGKTGGAFILVPLVIYTFLWNMYPMVEKYEGPKQAVDVMKKHPFLKKAQLDGCEVLYSLAKVADTAGKEDLVEKDILDGVLFSALHFEHDSDVLSRAIAVLGNLSSLEDVRSCLIQEEVPRLSVLWMHKHILNESVCRHAMVLLINLFACRDLNLVHSAREQVLKDDIIATTCLAMDANATNARLQQWGAVLLFETTLDVEDGSALLVKGGAVDQVVKTMLNHPTDEQIQRVSIGILARCLTKNVHNTSFSDLRKQIATSPKQVLEVVETVIRNFQKIAEIQLPARKIIEDCKDLV